MKIYSVTIQQGGAEKVARYVNQRVATTVAALFGTAPVPEYVSTGEKVNLPRHKVGEITSAAVTEVYTGNVTFKLSDGTGFFETKYIERFTVGLQFEVVVREIIPLMNNDYELYWHYGVEPVE